MEMPKKPKIEAGYDWDIGLALSQPEKCSVFDIDVVDFKSYKALSQNLPAKRLFVRGCYKALSTEIWRLLQKSLGVAVLGTPGIGKSLFGLLFLIETIQWLRQKKTVVLYAKPLAWPVVYATETTHYIFYEDGRISCKEGSVPIDAKPGFLILDGKATYNPHFDCPCVWLSSPCPDTFKKTIKREGFRRLYMPPWTADELVECWKQGCASERLFNKRAGPHWDLAVEILSELASAPDAEWQEEVLQHWIHELGPVPRRVFFPRQGIDSMMTALADEIDYPSLLRVYKGSLEISSSKFPHSHTLLLMIPVENYADFVFAPATAGIARRVLQMQCEQDLAQAQSLMEKMQGDQLGNVFQPYMEHILSLGGNFEVRSLEDNKTSVMDVAPCAKQLLSNKEFDELKASAPNTLYIPHDPDFPAVDCWTQNLMFQATVSLHHPIASAATRFLRLRDLRLVHLPRLVFVVPKSLAGEFKRQHFIAAGSKKLMWMGSPVAGTTLNNMCWVWTCATRGPNACHTPTSSHLPLKGWRMESDRLGVKCQ